MLPTQGLLPINFAAASSGNGQIPFGGFQFPLVFTPGSPVAHTAAAGTVVGSVMGKALGTTIICSARKLVYGIQTLELDGAHGVTRFIEPGQYPIRITETAGAPNTRYVDGQITLLPTGISLGDAWTPFVSDQYVINAFLQEDLSAGAVSTWTNRGMNGPTYDAIQADVALQPTKLAGTGGVEFAAGTAQRLVVAGDQNRVFKVRTSLKIVKVDPTTGATPGITSLIRPQDDGTGSPFNRSSALFYTRLGGVLRAEWRDQRGTNQFEKTGIAPNYSTWFFCLHFHRDGKLGVRWNGNPTEWHGYDTFTPWQKSDPSVESYIGHADNSNSANGAVKWALDCWMDLAEVNDATIYKLEWWAAQRAGLTLPVGHPYRSVAPVVDLDDFPLKEFKFNHSQWRDWQIAMESRNLSNKGQPIAASEFTPYSDPVFMDDYRVDGVTTGHALVPGIYYARGGVAGNTIGIVASSAEATNNNPDAYPWVTGQQGLLAGASPTGQLWAGHYSTVDRLDNGITFKGGGWWHVEFRVEFNGPLGTGLGPSYNAYFPCVIWFYNHVRAKMPCSSNFEIDTFEIECGTGSDYMNGFSHHLHPAAMIKAWNGRWNSNSDPDPYALATQNKNNLRRKLLGERLWTSNGWPTNIDQADGQWHDMDFIMDEDADQVICAIDGLEMVRFPLAWHWKHFRYHPLQNNSIRTNGIVQPDENCIMWLRKTEFRKKPSKTAIVPSVFSARPTISGTPYVGLPLTVDTKLSSMQARVEWYYSDGYPMYWAKSTEYRPSAADVGKTMRVKVVDIGGREDEEAWSAFTPAIQSNANPISSLDITFATGSASYVVNGVTYADWAAVTAAIPQMIYYRPQTGTVVEFGTGAITPFLAANTLRLHSYGLLYEPEETYANGSNPTYRMNPAGAAIEYNSWNGPPGNLMMHGVFEDSSTGTHRITDVNIGTTVQGQRTTILWLGRGGTFRSYQRMQAFYQGNLNIFYNFQNGTVTSTNGNAVPAGVTVSMDSIPGWTDHFWCSWSWTEQQVSGTVNASTQLYIARTNADTGNYTGDPSVIASRIGLYMVRTNTNRTKISLPWWGVGTRVADQMQIPLGPSPRTVTLTLVNPDDGTESTQVFNGVSGDWVVPAASLNQPVIKRIQI